MNDKKTDAEKKDNKGTRLDQLLKTIANTLKKNSKK